MRRLVAAVVVLGVLLGAGVAGAQEAPPPPRSFTIAATGDLLLHSPLWSAGQRYGRATGQAYDFRPMFDGVRPIISAADLAICHLETPFAPPGQRITTYPLFGVPAQLAQAIASAGYDRCSTASNHSLDRGTAGIDATLDALDANGVGHHGTARRPEEAAPSIVDVKGVRVAHLSYTYWFNGLRLPSGQPWRSNQIDPARIVADATAARAAGAEYVIVSLHWGTETVAAPNRYQRDVANAVTASGAIDLIIGHHAHVLQPIEQVNGVWVVYGLGNFLSNMGGTRTFGPPSQDGAILQVNVIERPEGGFATQVPGIVPTWVERGPYLIRPVVPHLADPATPRSVRSALQGSLTRTRRVLGPYVVDGGGPAPAPAAPAPAPTPAPPTGDLPTNVRPGTRSEAVKVMQTFLDRYGHAPGPIDGIYGRITAGAVRRFQADARGRGWYPYAVDGWWGPKTAAAAARRVAAV